MEIVDLCSGGTGPWVRLREQLVKAGLHVKVTLTDKFPSPEAIQKWTGASQDGIEYLPQAVDALSVPTNLKGMRTMFEGFHHFKPEQARLILQDACEKRVAIGIFEASLKPPQGPIIFLLSPLMTLLGISLRNAIHSTTHLEQVSMDVPAARRSPGNLLGWVGIVFEGIFPKRAEAAD